MSESRIVSLQEEKGQNSQRKQIPKKNERERERLSEREIQGENIAEAITEAEILSL